ncbi:MAG: DUF1289 domain-containing protein [Pseudomonadota bacterium]
MERVDSPVVSIVTPSPCIGVCELLPDGCCRGCGRTGLEIASWRDATEHERRRIVERATARLEAVATSDEQGM